MMGRGEEARRGAGGRKGNYAANVRGNLPLASGELHMIGVFSFVLLGEAPCSRRFPW